MKQKRLIVALVTGAVLGVFCIIGVSVRLGFSGNELFIFSTWINRVIMGLVIGLAPALKLNKQLGKVLTRGVLYGLVISGSFYLATNLYDTLGFFMGILYGVIIDYVATRYGRQ